MPSFRNNRERADAQAKRVGRQLGGREQPGSGSFNKHKGDAITKRFLVECKFTEKESYPLKVTEFQKIRKEALERMLLPIMQIEVGETKESLVVIRYTDFLGIMEELEEKSGDS